MGEEDWTFVSKEISVLCRYKVNAKEDAFLQKARKIKETLKMKHKVRAFYWEWKEFQARHMGHSGRYQRFTIFYCVFQMSLVYLNVNIKSLKIRHFIRLFNSLHYYHITLFCHLLTFGRVFFFIILHSIIRLGFVIILHAVFVWEVCAKNYGIGKSDIPNILNKLVFAHKISTPLDGREDRRIQRE